jgi:hypothetical protein
MVYLFSVYLTTLSVAQSNDRMMNEKSIDRDVEGSGLDLI